MYYPWSVGNGVSFPDSKDRDALLARIAKYRFTVRTWLLAYAVFLLGLSASYGFASLETRGSWPRRVAIVVAELGVLGSLVGYWILVRNAGKYGRRTQKRRSLREELERSVLPKLTFPAMLVLLAASAINLATYGHTLHGMSHYPHEAPPAEEMIAFAVFSALRLSSTGLILYIAWLRHMPSNRRGADGLSEHQGAHDDEHQ